VRAMPPESIACNNMGPLPRGKPSNFFVRVDLPRRAARCAVQAPARQFCKINMLFLARD
jgi:hypothetical protein